MTRDCSTTPSPVAIRLKARGCVRQLHACDTVKPTVSMAMTQAAAWPFYLTWTARLVDTADEFVVPWCSSPARGARRSRQWIRSAFAPRCPTVRAHWYPVPGHLNMEHEAPGLRAPPPAPAGALRAYVWASLPVPIPASRQLLQAILSVQRDRLGASPPTSPGPVYRAAAGRPWSINLQPARQRGLPRGRGPAQSPSLNRSVAGNCRQLGCAPVTKLFISATTPAISRLVAGGHAHRRRRLRLHRTRGR